MSNNATTYNRILTRGLESELPLNVDDGKLRFTTDTGKIFLDCGSSRIEFTDFIKDKSEQQILQTQNPLPKIYLSNDTSKLFYYDQSWKTINASTAEYAASVGTALNASTAECAIKDGSGNTITSTYAPITSPEFSGTPRATDIRQPSGSTWDSRNNSLKEAIGELVTRVTNIENTGIRAKTYLNDGVVLSVYEVEYTPIEREV